jgi:hypothetical protein
MCSKKSFSICSRVLLAAVAHLIDKSDNALGRRGTGKYGIDGYVGSRGGFGEAAGDGKLRGFRHPVADHLGWNPQPGFA